MSEIVERILRSYVRDKLSEHGTRPNWLIPLPGEAPEHYAKRLDDDVERFCNDAYRHEVTFIIAAIREPTHMMLVRGSDQLGKPPKTLPQAWRDMIDEALK